MSIIISKCTAHVCLFIQYLLSANILSVSLLSTLLRKHYIQTTNVPRFSLLEKDICCSQVYGEILVFIVTTQMFNVGEFDGVWGLYGQYSRCPCCQDEQQSISGSHKDNCVSQWHCILKKLDDSVGKIVDIYKVRDVDLGVMMSRQLQLFANTKIYL